MIRDGRLFKRYDFCKPGRKAPDGFEPCSEPDLRHWFGWIPVGDGPDDRWHKEAFATKDTVAGRHNAEVDAELSWSDGTYELVGPKVNGNPYDLDAHFLIPHGQTVFAEEPERTFSAIRAFLELRPEIEGIVYHDRRTGRMAKVKRRDFGLPWPPARGGDAG